MGRLGAYTCLGPGGPHPAAATGETSRGQPAVWVSPDWQVITYSERVHARLVKCSRSCLGDRRSSSISWQPESLFSWRNSHLHFREYFHSVKIWLRWEYDTRFLNNTNKYDKDIHFRNSRFNLLIKRVPNPNSPTRPVVNRVKPWLRDAFTENDNFLNQGGLKYCI